MTWSGSKQRKLVVYQGSGSCTCMPSLSLSIAICLSVVYDLPDKETIVSVNGMKAYGGWGIDPLLLNLST